MRAPASIGMTYSGSSTRVSHRAYKQQQAVAADVAALPLIRPADEMAASGGPSVEAAIRRLSPQRRSGRPFGVAGLLVTVAVVVRVVRRPRRSVAEEHLPPKGAGRDWSSCPVSRQTARARVAAGGPRRRLRRSFHTTRGVVGLSRPRAALRLGAASL